MPVLQRLDQIRRFLAHNLGMPNPSPGLLDSLDVALTHDSFSNEEATRGKSIENNELLEFLGDAAVGMAVTQYVYLHTRFREGDMTFFKQRFTCNEKLADVFRVSFPDLLLLIQVGEGQRSDVNTSILAGCFESIIGAFYLHGGMAVVTDVCTLVLLTPESVAEVTQMMASRKELTSSERSQ